MIIEFNLPSLYVKKIKKAKKDEKNEKKDKSLT